MQLRRRRSRFDADAGILPLINVVFLLLIFFMLAGRLTEAAPFSVVPPVSEQAAAAEAAAPREAAILVAADGRLALNGTAMDAGALRAAVAEALARRPDLPVSLKADGGTEAAEVVAVMESLRDAGVRRLQLHAQGGTQPPREASR
ncbi:MAG: ExbD/TolR family protein [Bacteroidota bacterium]|nr:biopolymer transporter ExbD [Kiloniellaceae bacterium]